MDGILIVSSVTYAQRASELLQKEGIYASLTRSTETRRVRGCGYGLRVSAEALPRAEEILKQNGIKVLKKGAKHDLS